MAYANLRSGGFTLRWRLSIASVIGNEVETQLLAEVSGPAAEVVELMESALRAGIVVNSPSGRPRYRFSHALVREALYQDLPAKRRNQLHAEIGQAIEAVHERNLEPHMAALANHYRMAGAAADAQKTIDYSIRAGRAAYGVFAYEEAGAHWRAALELMDEQGGGDRKRRAELLWLLGDQLVSGSAKAVEYLEAAALLFEELGDSQASCDVHTRTGMYLMARDVLAMDVRQARATLHFKKAEAFLATQPESERHALFYFSLLNNCMAAVRISDGLAAAKRAMEISERLDQLYHETCIGPMLRSLDPFFSSVLGR
ncbi:MAG TPA: hypothetical protein VEV37_03515 [Bryobacteraceae bacterium]|nr:hypothetical protein [Bryobacteraceae bacterium]